MFQQLEPVMSKPVSHPPIVPLSAGSCTRRDAFRLLAAAALLALPGASALAEKPLRIVVPFSAGSTIDSLARLVAATLPEVSDYKAVFVENRSGAAGIIGTNTVVRAQPDGYTLLLQANGLTTTPAVRDDLPFDTLKDLSPVILVGTTPYAFIAPASLPAVSLGELFDQARKSGQKISFGTSGLGSQSQFVLVQLAQRAKVEFLEVPFRGQAEIMLGVMGDQVQLGMMNLPSALQQMQDKRIKLLATITKARTPMTPAVPTVAESGLGDLEESAWYGFLAPANTPPAVIAALNKGIAATLRRPEAQAKLAEMGLDVVASSPEAFATKLKQETARYRAIADEQNLRARQQ
ncbi:hypothetical protein CAL26_22555 [Bordetella genomosp. 9]|uniref:ABC transporter substrate-binding protein n=2 Tax=Bordetella genomosp. 9 TaxID=1416803 RepID=A0A261R5K4_9BORD|nr:hypothetical protein CAL26_22555 [Bordetella genomosp. 9]